MSTYEVLLFLHVSFAIVWLGAGFAVQLLAIRADASGDPARITQFLHDVDWLAPRLFIPSSLAVFLLGIALVIEGPWGFDMLWIDLGLAGYAATFLTGLLVLTPQARRTSAIIERDGGMSPAALEQVRRLFLISRVDLVVLFVVVADMALKPTGDDTVLLAAMAAVVLGAAAFGIRRFRMSGVPAGPPAREPA